MSETQLFVIGDIHGERKMLETLLKFWMVDSQLLVFLGDLVDRGPDSYGVIHIARKLRDEYGAVVLGGNHESYFLEFLDNPEDKYFLQWAYDESIINDS
ncbi:putative MPP superfamily phosphohydrolase [Fontibacillus solani]|uniref:Putative MPP superfamily phosphohydrolase n=1 Tax=Fontibacillus solani TaxID=1572857 RepID=A0A7W3XT63_9BACL|nr:metallophosphoesterase [Fontibacillus solani]MBA9087288.1 putative MPP superfamily phosphohydrolase [Fontibacillus solani]